MSIFDLPETEPNLSGFSFFKPLRPEEEIYDLNQTLLFEGSIFCNSKFGVLSQATIRLIDWKLILFKKFPRPRIKVLDLTSLFSLRTKKMNGKIPYCVTLEKNHSRWSFFLDQKGLFDSIVSILSDFCVLPDFEKDYEIHEFLGKGHFAEVFRVRRKGTENWFAAKIFHKKRADFRKNLDFILKEIRLQLTLPRHPHIVPLYHIYENAQTLTLVFELMTSGDLTSFIRQNRESVLPESLIFSIFIQILKGTLFLHGNNLVHRDLKPDNVYIGKGDCVKIGDFSLIERFSPVEKSLRVECGTPGFMAPEVITDMEYDEKCDVYSLGLILYLLFTGKAAFRGHTVSEILAKNRAGKPSFRSPRWSHYSFQALNLVRKMLNKSPKNRIPLREVMRDEWVLRSLDTESTCEKLSMKNSETSVNNSLVQCKSQGWIRIRGSGKSLANYGVGSVSLKGQKNHGKKEVSQRSAENSSVPSLLLKSGSRSSLSTLLSKSPATLKPENSQLNYLSNSQSMAKILLLEPKQESLESRRGESEALDTRKDGEMSIEARMANLGQIKFKQKAF